MGRPVEPLITREDTIEVALRMIDRDGLGAFNLRRLGRELNVNAASLYHHFKNKDDILLGVARLALSEIRRPDPRRQPGEDGLELLIEGDVIYRRALLRHPELVPLIQQREAMKLGIDEMEHWFTRLSDEGVPEGRILPIVSALEAFVLGSVTYELARRGRRTTALKKEQSPVIRHALEVTDLAFEDQFRLGCHGIVDSILADTDYASRRAVVKAVIEESELAQQRRSTRASKSA